MSDHAAFDFPDDVLIELFSRGEIEIEGRMPYSSNTTLLVTVTADDLETHEGEVSHRAIYKPGRGERPLWDFPPDLYRREVAMYRLASALGWRVIPPTEIGGGPLGEGSYQAFVDANFSEHYFTLHEAGVAVDDQRQLCLLDWIANNTDRKSGHCLLGRDGHIYGIDNGLAFHEDFKLRTVIWDFVGEPIPAHDLAAIETFITNGPPVELCALLEGPEVDAMMDRACELVVDGTFPDDETSGHRWPWPLV